MFILCFPYVIKGKNGKYKLNKHGEILALKRARIVAGASEKLDALREETVSYTHLDVYKRQV